MKMIKMMKEQIIAGLIFILFFFPHSLHAEEKVPWKGVVNQKAGIKISFPGDLEPLEGKAFAYRKFFRAFSRKTSTNICFAPLNRRDFTCSLELYVSKKNLSAGDKNDFFWGYKILPRDKSIPGMAGGVRGESFVTALNEFSSRANVLVRKNGFSYLFVTDYPFLPRFTARDFRKVLEAVEFSRPR